MLSCLDLERFQIPQVTGLRTPLQRLTRLSRDFPDSDMPDSLPEASSLPGEEGQKIAPPELCRLLAFPAIGRKTGDESWRLEVEGFIYQRGEIGLRKRMLLRVLRRFMKADAADLNNPLFQQRVEAFVAGTERGHCPTFRVADGTYHPARRTYRNGRYTGAIEVPADKVPGSEASGKSTATTAAIPSRLEVKLGEHGEAVAEAPAFLIPETGVSLVSDIDDTIKITNVRQRREMLVNTFLKPFEAIDGMASVYQRLAASEVVFHYVSSSPWQLYEPLAELLNQAEFPAGSIHLRNFRLRDHMLRRMFLLHRRGKGGVIRHLIEMFPQRKFLLVGDSGERDPKIYAGLARQFPDQVLGILIRLLHKSDEESLRERFEEHPSVWSKFHLFTDPETLESQCHELLGTQV